MYFPTCMYDFRLWLRIIIIIMVVIEWCIWNSNYVKGFWKLHTHSPFVYYDGNVLDCEGDEELLCHTHASAHTLVRDVANYCAPLTHTHARACAHTHMLDCEGKGELLCPSLTMCVFTVMGMCWIVREMTNYCVPRLLLIPWSNLSWVSMGRHHLASAWYMWYSRRSIGPEVAEYHVAGLTKH